MAILTVEDVQVIVPSVDAAKAQAFIDDAIALALTVAPCLSDDDLSDDKVAAARAILRQTVARWIDRGSGITTQEGVGPFQWSQDTSKGGLFWPSEITALQSICGGGPAQGQRAFSVDMAPPSVDWSSGHWTSTTTWEA